MTKSTETTNSSRTIRVNTETIDALRLTGAQISVETGTHISTDNDRIAALIAAYKSSPKQQDAPN